MFKINWRIRDCFSICIKKLEKKYEYWKLCVNSLTYNHHMSQSYAADVLLEPIVWIVDNYANCLGRFFVVGAAALTCSVVVIAHWIGLPYWWDKSPIFTIILVVIGYWLLINVVFHYFMAVITCPGQPPNKVLYEAVSICKKCLTPKPIRTHHCSVCNRCVLKMDHHCPWLNNCVGHQNHRFFYMYMLYTVLGSLFLIIFGLPLAYDVLWNNDHLGWIETEPLKGQRVNLIDSSLLLTTETPKDFDDDIIISLKDETVEVVMENIPQRRALIFMAFVNVAVVIALGWLVVWHSKLIIRGETSIEAHVNQSEKRRRKQFGQKFVNPYDFGRKRNIQLFFGLIDNRTILKHLILPSTHGPIENGLKFNTIHQHDFFP